MHRYLAIVLLTSLLALTGCSNSSPAIPVPSSAGDFVRSGDGVGTAKVFGVDFKVTANASGVSSEDNIHADFIEPDKSNASKRFTFGDAVVIQLDSVNASEVKFLFNDQDYGTLKVGDQVVIDADGKVEVNGASRMPTSPGNGA